MPTAAHITAGRAAFLLHGLFAVLSVTGSDVGQLKARVVTLKEQLVTAQAEYSAAQAAEAAQSAARKHPERAPTTAFTRREQTIPNASVCYYLWSQRNNAIAKKRGCPFRGDYSYCEASRREHGATRPIVKALYHHVSFFGGTGLCSIAYIHNPCVRTPSALKASACYPRVETDPRGRPEHFTLDRLVAEPVDFVMIDGDSGLSDKVFPPSHPPSTR